MSLIIGRLQLALQSVLIADDRRRMTNEQ